MEYKYVGKSYLRPDAISKVTGKAIYLDDIRLPGMLHAAILRPQYAHAKILSIDTTEAEKCQGVVKVVTGKGCKFHYGDNIRDLVPMADEKVTYIGEPVAAVVADTPKHAREALAKIHVVYDPLPVYIDARQAMSEDAVVIHEDLAEIWTLPTLKPIPGTNIANVYQVRKGRAADGFDEADVVIEGEFNYPFASCAAIEPHGSIVWFKEDRTIEVWSSSICPFIIRDDLAHSYGIPASDVRVHIPDVGGCFGYKSDITVEQTIAWIASFVPGRPVKWVSSREEDFTSTLIGHGIRTQMKLGAKKDGKLVAIQAKILHSTGAYADTGVNVTMAATHNSTGPYEFDHCDLAGYTVYTNTPPVGAFRGYGHQEVHLAIERMMDILARNLKLDPLKLRAKNYLREGSVNSLGEHMWKFNGDIATCANKVQEAVYGHDKPEEDDTYLYGRGFAAVMKSPKGAPFSTKGCYMKMNTDGSVNINMGGAEVGQGLRTVVRQIAAEALKIPPEKVRVYTELDTQFSPYEWQTIGSMFTMQGGRAIVRAADKMVGVLKQTAAQVLKTDVDYLEYDGEFVYLRSDPFIKVPVVDLARGYITEDGITIGDIAQSVSDARLPRYASPDKNGQGPLGVTYTFGAQGAEIRIEKKTGKIFVDHFASVFDVGQVINPLQIRGSVLGGVNIGIGAALYEELVFDEEGRITNPQFFQYHIPTYKEMPRQTIEFIETPDPIGAFGARGIGEHSVLGPVPAILNAIYDATGIDFYEIPVTPDKMKKALETHKEYA
ncbi:MAG: xanthine dehydrogenase family protein molybdopterin-binding subunit [Bellilinea sp.]